MDGAIIDLWSDGLTLNRFFSLRIVLREKSNAQACCSRIEPHRDILAACGVS